MAFDETLVQRIRESLLEKDVKLAEEKYMFGGMCFMLRGHMCLGIAKNELMCRIGFEAQQNVAELLGCRPMDFTGRPMKGYVFVDANVLRTKKELGFWVQLCLDFNSTLAAT